MRQIDADELKRLIKSGDDLVFSDVEQEAICEMIDYQETVSLFEELKPCPFCGGKPCTQVVPRDYHVVVRVLCASHDCDVSFKRTLNVAGNFLEAVKAMHEVTDLWNTRKWVQDERNRE